MPHVFVETNWLFAYAAPAHHQIRAAVELLERARRGEFAIHIPNLCFGEARQAILKKCQPRSEANAIRRFLSWAGQTGHVAEPDAAATRMVLAKYESSIQNELDALDRTLRDLAGLPFVQTFALDDAMLRRSIELALAGFDLKPFDQAILAATLVRGRRLWEAGGRGISFCETDADLQPWDKDGNARRSLVSAYDEAHVWVYGDFTLTWPERLQSFE